MATILLIIQIFIVLSLILMVLLQKNSSDSLAGLSGGGHGVFSSRAASNLFTKMTNTLGIAFLLNSLLIAKVYADDHKDTRSIAESIVQEQKKQEPIAPKAE